MKYIFEENIEPSTIKSRQVSKKKKKKKKMKSVYLCMGSSIETVAFQVYEIVKINHEFLEFF